MTDTPLHYRSLAETCRDLKSGALTSVALTEHMLERIALLEPKLKAFAMVMAEEALAQAAALDARRANGDPLGALHGVPIGIKDLLFTEGLATASGTKVMADFKPSYDATVVTRLRAAGAVLIGKTQLTEGAFGSHHPDIDPPCNPYNTDHWPGVSSSGSGVSVAAGMAFGALGTDTGGSIRFPSAACGLVGIKPTYGRVSRYGAFELAASLDHIGPMTRTVEDAARMLGVIAGRDDNDETSLDAPVPNYAAAGAEDLNGSRIGVDWEYAGTGVTDEVVTTLREACERLADAGAELVEVSVPAATRALADDWGITCGVECARAHAEYYPAQKDLYGPNLAQLIELGLAVPQERYDELEVLRDTFRRDLDRLLEGVHMLIAPCMTSLAPTTEEMDAAVADSDERATFITFTAPFDYSGHPTITLPAGVSGSGLPKSFQLIGRHLGEPTLVRAGFAHEQSMGPQPHPQL